MVARSGPLASNTRVTLKLPRIKGCRVSVGGELSSLVFRHYPRQNRYLQNWAEYSFVCECDSVSITERLLMIGRRAAANNAGRSSLALPTR